MATLQKILLILARIIAFIFLCPGLSFRSLPNMVKVVISLSLTLAVFKIVPDIYLVDNFTYFIILIVKEIILGLAIGYIGKLVFGIFEIAGQFVDFQVGFAMANVYDKSIGKQVSNFGKIYYWISISLFFILDLHHRVLEGIMGSFKYVPITMVNMEALGLEEIIVLFSRVFEMGFNLAIPVVTVVLLTDIILGIISRTIPQINVLMLGMPLKALVGFSITIVSISWIINTMGKDLGFLILWMNKYIKFLGS